MMIWIAAKRGPDKRWSRHRLKLRPDSGPRIRAPYASSPKTVQFAVMPSFAARPGLFIVAWPALLLTACCGCASVGPASKSSPPLLMLRYEWPPTGVGNELAPQTAVAEDFRDIRELGFTTVWIDGVGRDESAAAVSLLVAAGLRPAMVDPDIARYVQYGRLPTGVGTPRELCVRCADHLRRLHRDGVLVLPPFPDPGMHANAEMATACLASLEGPIPTFRLGVGDFDALAELPYGTAWQAHLNAETDAVPTPNVVVLGSESGAAPATRPGAWLLDYYRGLSEGRTRGVFFWRYRSWPGEANGLTNAGGRIDAADAAAVRAVLRRSIDWSRLLSGAERVADASVSLESSALRWALFRRGARRTVLVYNSDTARFSRGALHIPTTLCDSPVARVVAQSSGERHLPHARGVTIPLLLRPGDAELFEIH